MDKKQELIEKITKMLEPYKNVENYSFTINLYTKKDDPYVAYTYNDNVSISYNMNYHISPYTNCTTI
ncbi:MAG: hypothetical protein ACI4S3_07360 [Candidatus Gastranaerophilaceae bacterium]